jgi:transcriptional regulator with XRE-family HTH domain
LHFWNPIVFGDKMEEPFSKRLQKLRCERNLSVAKIASRLEIAPSTYRAWEYGRAIQGHVNFIKLADALQVPLIELMLGHSSAMPQNPTSRLDQVIRELTLIRMDLLSLKSGKTRT